MKKSFTFIGLMRSERLLVPEKEMEMAKTVLRVHSFGAGREL